MDPNETLAEMRAAFAEANRLHDEADRLCDEANETGTENEEFQVREQAAGHDRIAVMRAEALDAWLSNGGFLPDAWRHNTTME